MRTVTRITLLLGLLMMTACESGWSMKGEVTLGADVDCSRQLLVLLYTNLPAGATGLPPRDKPAQVKTLLALDHIEGHTPVTFSALELGCTLRNFQVVAWAPKAHHDLPEAGLYTESTTLDPAPEDNVGFTDVLAPTDCGISGTQHVTVSLTALERR